ncbi:MAG: amino acid permease [Phycisphaeraceae bacterium]|nr:amino acid permease [Phycisphaeraceae bacterium]
MLVTSKRPRDLKWFHAGPLLFGDWGTSRLYVIGLAFYFAGPASPYFLAAMSVVLIAVAWAYTVVCRCFPEGGGVYAAARSVSVPLGVVGGTLLVGGYIITAAISVVTAFHYFGVPTNLTVLLSTIAIAGLGFINWFGSRSAGRFALLIAVLAVGLSLIIAILCVPKVADGLRATDWTYQSRQPLMHQWQVLVAIILALSGVEAVANMTGLMKQPVVKTARRTIWPVMAEVVTLNLVFGIALVALPALTSVQTPWYDQAIAAGGEVAVGHGVGPSGEDPQVVAVRDTAMKVLAIEAGTRTVGEGFGWLLGKASALIFGFLLISAVSTAIMAQTSVLFSLAHDRELPRSLTKLNYSGVPWIGLLVACILPVIVMLIIGPNMPALAELYAIGVVGAISINLLSCAWNRALPILRWERAGILVLGLFLSVVEITIVVSKPRASIFAGILIAGVFAARWVVNAQKRRREAVAAGVVVDELGVPTDYLAELNREPLPMDPGKARIMLAARGRGQAEFAVDMARRRGAALFAIYVRTFRILDTGPGALPSIEDDKDALESLGSTAMLARQYGVPFFPIYVSSPEIVEEILDYTVTFGCDTLILGKTRRKAFARALEGDVVTRVAEHLPSEVVLITRDATPHPLPPPPNLLAGASAPGTPASVRTAATVAEPPRNVADRIDSATDARAPTQAPKHDERGKSNAAAAIDPDVDPPKDA